MKGAWMIRMDYMGHCRILLDMSDDISYITDTETHDQGEGIFQKFHILRHTSLLELARGGICRKDPPILVCLMQNLIAG